MGRISKGLSVQQSHQLEQAVIAVSGKAAGVGGGTAAVGGIAQQVIQDPSWITLADLGVYFGIFVGGASLIVHTVAQWRRDRRETKLFNAKMTEIYRRKD